jgi:predicted Na+-dependent transporter
MVINLFAAAAGYGRLLLVLGLIAGIMLPWAATFIRGYVPELIALLLFLAAFRVGPRAALGALSDLRLTVGSVLLLQVVTPILIAVAFLALGVSNPIAIGIMLMAAASPISGSPNMAIMTGNDPAPSLRLLVLGTALLPLTVVPVFWIIPGIGSAGQVLPAAARLLALIGAAAAVAFMLRQFVFPNLTERLTQAVDGASALGMAVVVVGLMVSVGPAITQQTTQFVWTLLSVFAANFGLQLVYGWLAGKSLGHRQAVAIGIASGNRNIALFLTALPAGFTDQLMLFIGCYQIPMYLTPIIMERLYRQRNVQKGTSDG